ncbi:MAG: DUF3857 domain-containing protein [Myxococcales bacterium]|jgi:tetratricopeptide (TPR) repeat protein
MPSRSPLICSLAAGLAAVLAFGSALAASDPFAEPPLTSDPSGLLSAVNALPAPGDESNDFVLWEVLVRFDEKGRRSFTARSIYRPLQAEAVRALGSVRAVWSPWNEERPTLDARVVTADGRVFRLDPKTIGEAPVNEGSPQIFDDRRILRAPLPGVEPNAVVEEVVVSRETEPPFDAGITTTLAISDPATIRRARVVVEAPKSLPLRYSLRGTSAKPRRTVSGELQRLVLELESIKPPKDIEPFLSPRLALVPTFAVSTGESWKAVGARYAKLVEAQLLGAELSDIVERVAAGEKRPEEIAARLTDWLQQTIRYTGVHFGQAKIVPRTPAETLARGFGDCKDMSTLLVGLLRKAGVPAHVALISLEGDVDEDLPGLGQFDHAIVYVPEKKPLWIDPTNPSVAHGVIPIPLQGKLALVTGTGANKLVRTPVSRPSDNLLRVVREIFLVEEGLARIVEARESFGAIAAWYRSGRPESATERREFAEKYGKAVFGAEAMVRWDEPPLGDKREPFRTRLELEGCQRAQSSGLSAGAGISAAPVVAMMPDFLKSPPEDPKAPEKGWRKRELALPVPYRAEAVYRIVPPPGFVVAGPLPEDSKSTWGPATFSQHFSVADNGTVIARYVFDTGPGHFSPAAVEQLAAGLRALAAAEEPIISFELKAAQLFVAGKKKEAFDEYQRLIARHPKEARHHLQLAAALLEAGFGLAARESARRAVELEPESVDALVELARILQHDEIGRFLEPGYDRAGAIAALRKAKALAPKHFRARAALAFLLEHNAEGMLFAAGADLEEAVAEYRALHELGPEHDDRLLILDLKRGRLDELEKDARVAEPTLKQKGALVAVAAAKLGAKAALAEAERLAREREARRNVLTIAGNMLVQLRHYPEAAALLREAAVGSPDAYSMQARAALLDKVRRHETFDLSGGDPATVFKRLLVAVLSPTSGEKDVSALMARRASKLEEGSVAAIRRHIETTSHAGTQDVLTPVVLLDFTVSLVEISLDGDEETGWRAVSRLSSAPGISGEWFLVREGGEAKLLTAGEPEALISEVLRRVERGDLKGAKRWLGWARVDNLSPTCPGESEAETLKRAAIRELAVDDAKPEHVEPLTQALACAQGKDRELTAMLLGRALAAADKAVALLGFAEKELAFDEEEVVLAKATAYRMLGKMNEARAFLEKRLEAKPDDRIATRLLGFAAMETGDFDLAERLMRKLIETEREDTAGLYNDIAWLAAFRPQVPESAIEEARRAVAASNERSRPALHTLATLYAQTGRPDEAMQVLRKAVEIGGRVDSDDWYVIGRAAEEYGLVEEAKRAYRRVEAPKKPSAVDTHVLAQKRLEALE